MTPQSPPDHPEDLLPLPRHVAIIMDGNGRWATGRGLPRTAGHQRGAEALKRTVRTAGEMGIAYLTVFGFSSENWVRPESEISELMRLLRMYLRAETAELHRNDIRLQVIGDTSRFDADIVDLISNAESLTAMNTKITVTIALNYGGRQDILQAACRMAEDFRLRDITPDLARVEKNFEKYLLTADLPEPDLLIRTSGEQRISNFLLWQCAYSELYFSPTLWPDFDSADLQLAVDSYRRRTRRFGGLKPASLSREQGV